MKNYRYPEAIESLRQQAIVLDGLSTPAWDSITQNFADKCKADAVQIRSAIKALQGDIFYVVLDENGFPDFCSAFKDTCHEHINDAINDFDVEGAPLWKVRPAYLGEAE